jgi:hypothetical protein
LAVADARQFDGKRVVVQFTAAPPYTWRTGGKLVTVTGPAKDDAEWSVALAGNRLSDAGEGARLKVTGVLKVIEHPPTVVNGKMVPAWTEVRLTEG